MSETIVIPVIGSEAFWVLYDRFCSEEEFKKLSNGKQTDLCLELQQILRKGHDMIVKLERPENGWGHPKAWLVMRYEIIFDKDGYVFMHLEAGDVMTREFGWDRDVFVTHSPIIERVSGQFLGQGWPNAKRGLFLPLFNKNIIMTAIRVKAERNLAKTLAKAEEEARVWRWY